MLHLFGGNDLLFALALCCCKTTREENFSFHVRFTSFLVCRVYLLDNCQCLWISSSIVLYINILCSRIVVKNYVIFCALSINLAL